MNISKPKLKAILKYFIQNTSPRFLGKTKLMKLFYFTDFNHVKQFGLPITGDTYYHLEQGPIPSAIKNLIDEVEANPEWSILSDVVEIKQEDGESIHRIKALQQFTDEDKDYFSEIELHTLEQVCKRFNNSTTKEIVDASHEEAPYSKTEELARIPYTLAAEDPDCQMSKEEIKLLTEELGC